MSSHPAQAATPNHGQPATDPHAYHAVLHGLIGMGANLARTLHDTATIPAGAATPQPPAPATLIALAKAFDGTARTVRRCIALSRALSRPVHPAKDPAHHRTAARKRILREVEDTIGRDADTPDHAASLTAELRERLDAPDLDEELATRPIEDIVKDIRRDLGLASLPGARTWKRRTPQDLADLHARAAAPSRSHPSGPASIPCPPAHATQPEGRRVSHQSQPGPIGTGNPGPGGRTGPIATARRHPMQVGGGWHLPPVAKFPAPPAHRPVKEGSG